MDSYRKPLTLVEACLGEPHRAAVVSGAGPPATRGLHPVNEDGPRPEGSGRSAPDAVRDEDGEIGQKGPEAGTGTGVGRGYEPPGWHANAKSTAAGRCRGWERRVP